MSVIAIRPAERAGARLVIGIAGISGSGKTRTAIEFAYGLANYDASKVGFLDTENRRGSLYADVLKSHATHPTDVPFWIGDLEPPFTPERYSEAIRAFQDHGVEVLVLDSVSHEYEGTGGVLEIREPAPGTRGKRDNVAKERHKKFMNVLLQSNMHVIPCIRAREKVIIEKKGGETVYIPQGVQPIQEKNFMFELTASLMMWNEGKSQEVIKCPGELRAMLGRCEGYITSADGKAVRDWVDGGGKLDAEVEQARNTLRTTTEGGVEAYRQAWNKTSKRVRDALTADGTHEILKRAAQDYDNRRTESKAGGAALAGLNASVLNGETGGGDDEDIEAG
jgi:hypothetical protein